MQTHCPFLSSLQVKLGRQLWSQYHKYTTGNVPLLTAPHTTCKCPCHNCKRKSPANFDVPAVPPYGHKCVSCWLMPLSVSLPWRYARLLCLALSTSHSRRADTALSTQSWTPRLPGGGARQSRIFQDIQPVCGGTAQLNKWRLGFWGRATEARGRSGQARRVRVNMASTPGDGPLASHADTAI